MIRCVLLLLALSACARGLTPPDLAAGPADRTIFLVERGWHSDVALRAEALEAALPGFAAIFPGARYLAVGFGERAYVTAPYLGVISEARALFPSPGALLVTGLSTDPQAAFPEWRVTALRVTEAGEANLARHLAGEFGRDTAGRPALIDRGPYPGSLFYAATTPYSGVYTCNTWTAEALAAAGLPIRAEGVLFSGQVRERAAEAGAGP